MYVGTRSRCRVDADANADKFREFAVLLIGGGDDSAALRRGRLCPSTSSGDTFSVALSNDESERELCDDDADADAGGESPLCSSVA